MGSGVSGQWLVISEPLIVERNQETGLSCLTGNEIRGVRLGSSYWMEFRT